MSKQCPNCQSLMREEATFCPACGTKTTPQKPAETLPDIKPSGKKKVLLITGIACAFVVFAAAAFLYFFNNKAGKPAPAETPGTAVHNGELSRPALVELATPSPSPVSLDTESIIESIRTRYYAAQDEMHTYKIETNASLKKYFCPAGTLARVDTPNAGGGGDSYYYDNGSLYFVFSYYGTTEHRFYFDNGRLVRWIYSPAPAEEVYESAEAHPDFTYWESQLLTQSATHNADVRYRVRPSAEDAAGQIGAYVEFENAKNAADAKPGYKVYDMYGTLIYEP
ncbi:MAG: zinc ribbon domain-containing protein [Ruminococcaceae bacterium]|nr:zinc ribbon domain-containing protein [Oscillospiraceae bacterium]